MLVQRNIQFSSHFSDIAKTVHALSYFDSHDEDDYNSYDIAKLLHDNEYEEVLDGFHIEEVHEFDDEIYQLYYEILLKM
jgi:hypothetical protein